MYATVKIDTNFNKGAIDRRIFGGFLEHLGRAVYEGVYDPAGQLSDAQGFRTDVIKALRFLQMPVIRYPGGNFVSGYNWKHGIGPKEQRPRKPDYAWRSIETNQFGTNEFMAWCRAMDTEPMMAVNLGTAAAAEAGELVEYCNFPGNTKWSDLRREHGIPDPYNIKLWCLGNEMDGPWQAGHVPAEVYSQRAFQASFLMKGIDNRIETIACGSSGRSMSTYMEWDRKVLEYCWDTIDYISAHRYSDNFPGDTAWYLAEGIEIDRILADYSGLINYVKALKRSNKNVYLSFDEWNVWYRARSGSHTDGNWSLAPHLLEEVYNMEDALVCAQYLAAFLRRADLVKIACIAQIVNVIAPILTKPDGLLIQTIYYPFLLFSKYARGISLTPVIKSPDYKAGSRGDVPALDAASSFDPLTGELCFFLVNRNPAHELEVRLSTGDRKAVSITGVDLMGGGDVKAHNSWDNPGCVGLHQASARIVDGNIVLTLPAPGFAVARVKTQI